MGEGIAIGVALIVLGAIFIFLGWRNGSRRNRVHAGGGSVAVGGNNSGPIINTNVNAPPPEKHGTHWLTVIGILVELVGIGVTVWHALHLGAP